MITDPPYYYSVQYGYLADFFYVWLRRMLSEIHPSLFAEPLSKRTTKSLFSRRARVCRPREDNAFYQRMMRSAMPDARRILRASGIGIVVFAIKRRLDGKFNFKGRWLTPVG